jgi:hypothetical protein
MFLPQNEGDSRLMLPEKRNRPQIETQTARDVEDAAHRELGEVSTLLVGGTQRLSEFIWRAEGRKGHRLVGRPRHVVSRLSLASPAVEAGHKNLERVAFAKIAFSAGNSLSAVSSVWE